MKFLTITLIISSGINCYSQAPDYLDNNPKWHCYTYVGIQEYNYVKYISDTVSLGGFDYQDIYERGEYYPDYMSSSHSNYDNHSKYIRQVGKSIRYYDPFGNDTLLVNYDLNIGDSIKHNFYSVLDPFDTLTVQRIDSILIGSEYRKVFDFDTLNTKLKLIEGIGHLWGWDSMSAGEGEFLNPIQLEIGAGSSLYCYGHDSTVLWTNNGSSNDCNLTTGIVGLEKNTIPEIIISPNPSSLGYVNVELPNAENFNYQLYSSSGQLLQQGLVENQQIKTPHQAGIYFLIIQGAGARYYQKLIVE